MIRRLQITCAVQYHKYFDNVKVTLRLAGSGANAIVWQMDQLLWSNVYRHRTGYSVGHQARRTWWIIVQNCSNEFPLLQHRQMVFNGNLLVSGKVFASPTYALIYIDCKCHHFAATILNHSSMSSHIGFWHFENISTWKDSARNIWDLSCASTWLSADKKKNKWYIYLRLRTQDGRYHFNRWKKNDTNEC